MKILIVDNNIDPNSWGSPDLRRHARLAQGATQWVRRGPANDLPETPEGFDRIIVSGSKASCLEESPWVKKLLEFMEASLHKKIPLLGVCFGHQLLARALGGIKQVGPAGQPEYGWIEITLTNPHPLFEGLSNRFHTFSSHVEEVKELPPGTRLLASSKGCQIQAFEMNHQTAFGVQFHPEKSIQSANDVLQSIAKAGRPKEWIFNANQGTRLFSSAVGEKIFSNFLNSPTFAAPA